MAIDRIQLKGIACKSIMRGDMITCDESSVANIINFGYVMDMFEVELINLQV